MPGPRHDSDPRTKKYLVIAQADSFPCFFKGECAMPSQDQQILPLTTDTDDIKECRLQIGIGVGNCQQLQGSRVALQRSEILPGSAQAVWEGTTQTTHHQPLYHDTWHQTLLFLTGDGKIVTQIAFDGPDMGEDNRPYPFLRIGTVNFDPSLFGQIKTVHWIYAC
jgi:hypothetical protein